MKTQPQQASKQEDIRPMREGSAPMNEGNPGFEDNRTGTAQLKKLREGFAGSPQDEGVAQLQKSMREGGGQNNSPIQRKANKTGLPDQLKSGIENLSGYAMDDVKVHYNSSQPAQLHAHAYAQGTDIHVGPGQEKHLGHEAWHVVQQKQGRVKPTRQLKSKFNINDDVGLEKEADVMGAKAMHAFGPVQRIDLQAGNEGTKAVAQRVEEESQPGELLGKALTKMGEVLESAGELKPKVDAVDLAEFEEDLATLEENLTTLQDTGARVKAIDDFLAKHRGLVQEVHFLNEKSKDYKLAHKDQLRKLGHKNPEITTFEETGNIEGLDETAKKAFHSIIGFTAEVAAKAAGFYATTSGPSFDLQLLRVDELAKREIHTEHIEGLPNADIYIPASGKTNRVTYVAHGDHTALKGTDGATFKAPKGVTMAYTAPHGYDALASLTSAWGTSKQGRGRDILYNFSPGPVSRRYVSPRWYEYNLKPEGGHMGDQMKVNLQNLADENGVTAVVIKEVTTTSALLPQLTALGYSSIFPVHCRGTHDHQSQMWAAKNYETETRAGYGLSYAKDTYANAKSDPGPQTGENHVISREKLLKPGTFYDAGMVINLDEDLLEEGLIVQHQITNLYYRLWGITATQAFLRGLNEEDGILMAQDDTYFAHVEGDSEVAKATKTKRKAKKDKLANYHKNLDSLQRYAPWTLAGYSKFI